MECCFSDRHNNIKISDHGIYKEQLPTRFTTNSIITNYNANIVYYIFSRQ